MLVMYKVRQELLVGRLVGKSVTKGIGKPRTYFMDVPHQQTGLFLNVEEDKVYRTVKNDF